MICAGILAGGQGIRMKKKDLPKQFLELNGKPIITYAIESFLLSDKIDKIIIGIPSEWEDYTKEIMKKYFPDNNIDIIIGRCNKK